jgi:hypothetical protein
MARTLTGLVLAAFCSLAASHANAQTGAVNPQRPARSVTSGLPQKRVQSEAARIDALLTQGLQRHREAPTEPIDDATFVRRAHLTIVGRIPTLAETERFLADQSPDKRSQLCDRLLDSQGRTSHFANFWFDLLRVKSRQRQTSGEPFAHYLRDAIQQDRPYDQMVRELLVAEGPAHELGHGATGYLLRDQNMPHDAMANTLRLFLGTRLECAQCHNHPFDTWTQREFYEMAAFFGGLRYRLEDQSPNVAAARALLANADERTKAQARQLQQRMNQGIAGNGSGVERLPADYKYDDGKPQSPVLANTMFGTDVKLKYPETKPQKRPNPRARPPEVNSRQALADWMTSPKNPRFTKVIVNRMWARTFGRGLVEPIDDWKKDTEAVHPELFGHLEKLLVDLDYDLRQFERILVHTDLFARSCPPEDPAPEKPYTFRGPLLRRMTAEQIWDSLLTLVFDDVDERLRAPDARAKEVYEQFREFKTATPEQLVAMAEQRRAGQMSPEMQQQQREEARRQLAADAELQKRTRPLLRELADARRAGNQKRVAEIAAELQQAGLNLGQRAARGQERDLLRASDLTQPAAPSHLLRQFGQSDRETIDAASTEATVPQVLTLLNGFLDQRVLEGASALKRDLETAPNGERRVRIAFLTTLNREPTAEELQEWRRAIAIDGEVVVRDLVWVLCNSNEFRFVQ